MPSTLKQQKRIGAFELSRPRSSDRDSTMAGMFQTQRDVVEAVQALGALFKDYSQCVRSHQSEKEKYKGLFEIWIEETMRAAERQGLDPDGERPIVLLPEQEEVVSDVVLQHKQGLLDEWVAAEDVWELQAETWARKCVICRIREGRRVKHDWRECPSYPEDRERVEKAHQEVEKGILSVDGAEELEGRCGECLQSKTRCWLQIKSGVDKKGCKQRGVVTESVSGILAIGPDMVREWEEREGRRKGAGVEGVAAFAGLRYGAIAACRAWRTFGWAGIWDIREAKVDRVREAYHGRLQALRQQSEEPVEPVSQRKELYGVRGGKIGGQGGGRVGGAVEQGQGAGCTKIGVEERVEE